ncbi:Peroxisome biosynthesis protein (Peroxin-10) [Lasiodiplodia theobromae]|uniref:Peroxisome biosynthesis protein (Peroxin-10) n=1 Tax=Lasiodiplodia theobromae TaxID=45133 RepID=UPI0015C34F76|nr:Peroxisome biosynthesis protein (Peroxin-10) [Lasiodiplodia theobromae]KAF4537014.1 Peroxisome biosynthesis protein (Peroxin-10) [Lasiodiplodia theobromae]
MATIQQLCPDAATEPATAATLQKLRDEDKIDCPICLLPFADLLTDAEPNENNSCADPITLQACTHTFCTACLKDWIRQSPTHAISCPMCRTHIGHKADAYIWLQENAAAYARANHRMTRFGTAYITASITIAYARTNNLQPPTMRFRAEQIYSAGGGVLSLMSDAINNFPPPPPPQQQAGLLPVRLPTYGSPRFLRFASALPIAALGVVRQLGAVAEGDPALPDQPFGGLWHVAVTTTATELRRLILTKLFELYLERYGIDVPGAGELPGGIVSGWQRLTQVALEAMLAPGGMPGDDMVMVDRTLMEVDRYARMIVGAILVVGDNNDGFQGVVAAEA